MYGLRHYAHDTNKFRLSTLTIWVYLRLWVNGRLMLEMIKTQDMDVSDDMRLTNMKTT